MTQLVVPRSTALARTLTLVALGAALAGCRRPVGVAPDAPSRVVLGPANGPLTHTPQPTTSAITIEDLKTRLYLISDDSMLGREAGGPGNVKVTDYIASELRRLGLEPAGENGGFFQTIPMVTRPLDSTRTALSVDGQPLALWRDWAPIPPASSMPFSGAAPLDAPVVFGGRAGDTTAMIAGDQAVG